MIPDLKSSRGKSTTSEIGFYPGHLEERLTGGTQRTTGLMVRYEVIKVSRWLSTKDLKNSQIFQQSNATPMCSVFSSGIFGLH